MTDLHTLFLVGLEYDVPNVLSITFVNLRLYNSLEGPTQHIRCFWYLDGNISKFIMQTLNVRMTF